MNIVIEQIRTDGGTQPRAMMDMFVVEDYAQSMRDGVTFPPLTVFYDGTDYWLADGFHRLQAAKQAELELVTCDIKQGTRRDAILFSVGANAQHGLRRTNADKRRAVETILNDSEWRLWTDVEIARKCVVDNSFVSKLRKDLSLDNPMMERKATRNGTTYTIDTTNIGRPIQLKKVATEAINWLRDTPIADNPQEKQRFVSLPEEKQIEVAQVIASGKANNISEAKTFLFREDVERQREAIATGTIEMPKGVFEVIALDPPWPYGTEYDAEGRRAANPYPEMSLGEIASIELPAANDCVLWLWTTHKFMRHSFDLLDGWGFRDVAILTWVKDRMGLGTWLRSQSEFCIMAVKGKPTISLTNQTTIINGPLREHSRKPDEFYSLVDSLCVGRKLEYFSREARPGWQVFGNDTERF